MKGRKYVSVLVDLFGIPVILIILGLVLVVSPDSASALVSYVLGGALVACGAGSVLVAVVGSPEHKTGRLVCAAILLVIGLRLICSPLMLARSIGKFLGILLAVRGIGGIVDTLKVKKRGGSCFPGLVVHGVTLLIGIWLLSTPMAPTRILMTIVGIVMIAIGIADLVSAKNRFRFLLEDGNDHRIVDADE